MFYVGTYPNSKFEGVVFQLFKCLCQILIGP